MSFAPFPLAQREAEVQKKEEYRQDLAVRLLCNNCPPGAEPNIVEEYSSGDLVCGNCGLVLGDRIIDTRSEWRTFANDEGGDDPSRVGAATNPLLEGSGGSAFETQISFRDGRTGISKALQNAAARISTKSGDKTLAVAFGEIQSTCDQINLPRTVADSAKQLFKRQNEEKICRGKSPDAVQAACIFIACRLAGVARTFKEIHHLTQVDKKKLADCYKLLKAAFEPTATGDANGDTSGITSASSAAHQVGRFCNHLGLAVWIEAVAKAVCLKILDMGDLTGRSPITVAGTAIYLASHLIGTPKSAADVARVAGMAEGTLRNAYRIIYPSRGAILAIPELKRYFNDGRADASRLPAVRSEGANDGKA